MSQQHLNPTTAPPAIESAEQSVSIEALRFHAETARLASIGSPCQSKRGAVIFHGWEQISYGCNYQPYPFVCDGSERCKQNCGRTAIHAEQNAILEADRTLLSGASLIHVKSVDGNPVASMAPSCLECSKLMLAVGIANVYLLHPAGSQDPSNETVGEIFPDIVIRRYSAARFHWLTANAFHRVDLLWVTKPEGGRQ